jgi:hypothetical protein
MKADLLNQISNIYTLARACSTCPAQNLEEPRNQLLLMLLCAVLPAWARGEPKNRTTELAVQPPPRTHGLGLVWEGSGFTENDSGSSGGAAPQVELESF